jgi:hypothetical protein
VHDEFSLRKQSVTPTIPSLVIAVAKEPAASIYRAPSPNDPNNAILRAAAARRKQELKKKQRYLGGQVPFAT